MDAGGPVLPLDGEGDNTVALAPLLLLLPDAIALRGIPLQQLGPDGQAVLAAAAVRAVLVVGLGALIAVNDLPGLLIHHQQPLVPLVQQLHQHLGIAFDDPGPTLGPLDFLLQLRLPFQQLLGHGVKRLGKLAQMGHVLRIIPLCHLLGLPGKVLEVGVEIFQPVVEAAAALREGLGQAALGQLGGIGHQLLRQALEGAQGLAQLPAGLAKTAHVQAGLAGVAQNVL